MAVYDCTLFFNENELFEIKLNEHWDVIDKFIVIESRETHTGNKKELYFDHERFKPYSSKIEYRSFDSFDEEMQKYPEFKSDSVRQQPASQLDAERDHYQFNYTVKVLNELGAKDDDLVFFACLDEIISKAAFLEALKIFENKDVTYDAYHCISKQVHSEIGKIRPIVGFELAYYAYKFNAVRFPHGAGYQASSITEFSTIKKMLPGSLRANCLATHPYIRNAGWHFSFADNTDGELLHKKMQNWAHSREIYPDGSRRCDLNKEEAVKFILKDFNMSIPECIIPIDIKTHPKYLVDNQEKFKDFIYKL
jgi:hypothetical protein